MSYELDQFLLPEFFDECTRDQLLIQNLYEQNQELRRQLIQRGTNDQLTHPKFLQTLVSQSLQNKDGPKRYGDGLKDASLHLFMLTGPTAYGILQKNLAMPSLSTVRRRLGKEDPVLEGEFQFQKIKKMMEENDEPLFVWIAEDDTKIVPRARYDINEDIIVGLELPLDANGVPKKSPFKFSSVHEARSHLENNPLSSYAKLLTCRSLKPGSRSYQLVIYGTQGSNDNAKMVQLRWRFVYDGFAKVGITVLGE